MGMDCSWVERTEDPESDFRLSWAFVGAIAREMDRQGMLKDVETPTCTCGPFNGRETADEETRHFEICLAVDTGVGGIPSFKFMSNYWVVTPTEIEGALEQMKGLPIAHPDHETRTPATAFAEYSGLPDAGQQRLMTIPDRVWAECWEGWLRFLRGAASHGGFRCW